MTRIWLTVIKADSAERVNVSGGDLWVREVEFTHLPDVGDPIFILSSEEEPEGCVSMYVRHRYWDIDGTANLELQRILVNPTEEVQDRLLRYTGIPGVARYTAWYTERDGADLGERLAQHWLTHEHWRQFRA